MKNMTEKNPVHAVLRCVTPPDADQLAGFYKFLRKKYHTEDVEIETKIEPAIHGGFILQIGSEEYDWSVSGRTRQFEESIDEAREEAAKNHSEKDIISVLKGAVEDFQLAAKESEVGFVETAGDGIVHHQAVSTMRSTARSSSSRTASRAWSRTSEDNIGAILFDEEGTIGEGTRVTGTGKSAGIPAQRGLYRPCCQCAGRSDRRWRSDPVEGGLPCNRGAGSGHCGQEERQRAAADRYSGHRLYVPDRQRPA
jgi:hypothetical protein